MRRIHLLRVDQGPAVFAPLLAEATAAGLCLGWLELAAPPDLPAPLEAALAAGLGRAVVAGERWSLAARPRRGAWHLRELMRQQFLGCAAVLVRGALEAPLLTPDGAEWRVAVAAGLAQRLTTAELVAALRRPLPFAPATPVT